MTIFNKTCSKFAEYFQFIYVKPDCNIAAKSKHIKDILIPQGVGISFGVVFSKTMAWVPPPTLRNPEFYCLIAFIL